MKKLFSFLLLLVMVLTLTSATDSLVKKKKKVIKRKRYRRIVRNWPQGGPRPVFPKAGDERAAAAGPPPAAAAGALPAKPAVPAKDYFFAEGGLAGGGVALEIGYGRNLNEKLSLSGALGFVVFSNDNGVVLDLARMAYNFNGAFVGMGLSYARSLTGLELFAGRQFDRWSARAGYSGALGFRAAAGYQF